MWHEARKQEKKIRGMLVDYRRRAERRRDYYEKIKSDPTQFLQLHGRPCKIHLDPAIATAGDSPANMMPWQGNEDNLIDRFDVRAHLDWIPEAPDTIDVDIALTSEDRHINYERYRIIVQNEFLGVTEEKFLHQIHLEEQFGSSTKLDAARDKKKSSNNVAIGYNYETEEPMPETMKSLDNVGPDDKDDEDSDIDLDICVDVSQIEPSQAHEMNLVAQKYGLLGADYFSFLTQDFEEAETLRQARKQEEEKAMYSGRRSRRERRAFREKKMIGRVMSPPSYAARESPEYNPYRKSSSKSRSRSISPVNAGQITYITSFGGEEETHGSSSHVASSNSRKMNYSHLRRRRSDSPTINERTVNRKLSKSRSRSCSRSVNKSKLYRNRDRKRSTSKIRSRRTHSRHRKINRSRSRSRSRRRSRSESRSRYRSYTRSRSRTTSRSRSRSRIKRSRSSSTSSVSRSKSRSRSRSRSKSRNRSRSRDSYRRRHYSPSKSSSKSRSKSQTRSRSRSRSNQSRCKRSRSVENKPPALPRYYGRRGKSSSLELELSDNEEKASTATPKQTVTNTTSMNKPKAGLSTNSGGGHKSLKITPQERLKKKMQALLNRQYKADKKAEQLRIEKMEQQRQDREDEIREMSLKLRRKQRERRHRYEGHSSESHSSVSRTPSPGNRSPRISRRDRKERDFDNPDRERDRDNRERERGRGEDRNEKFRTESNRRRYRDSPLRSLSPRNSRGLVDY
ncbi:CLK4-associating serine/arginine rich protein isoform X2 [Ceratina calcarata]|nr:CLK4-associating serine/arginine rich protein isoform X2 [Ceratina calcarata]